MSFLRKIANLVIVVCSCINFVSGCTEDDQNLHLNLNKEELQWVGLQIYRNECAAKRECLVTWNQGEDFPSLGIGHFIWYPVEKKGPFIESFPQLIAYLQESTIRLPDWLEQLSPFAAPWPDREAFYKVVNQKQVESLRVLLEQTQWLQAAFMLARAQASLNGILAVTPENQRQAMSQNLSALLQTRGGIYALIDYVNFKGEGLSSQEQYQGQGWGLRQVLETMDVTGGITTLAAFRLAAIDVLTRRARLAPRSIEREKWLAGWIKRVETYRERE